jgi:protein-disulfide isomerase
MLLRLPTPCSALALGLVLAGPARAQQAPPTLRQEVQALKADQQRILAELAEIKALLRERAAAPPPAAGPTPAALQSINVHGEPFRGASGARVAIMEYSDFDCSFCARYATQIYPKLDADYIRTGRVKYFFRDLPLPVHPDAPFKARLARCAAEQGKFWEVHDRLFADQRGLDAPGIGQLSRDLGLDAGALQACADSGKYAEGIRLSARSAERLGIMGTPAFVVGTLGSDGQVLTVAKVLVGAPTYEGFRELLDGLLGASPAQAKVAPAKAGSGSTCD